ncbi:MAG: 30S ribosomal protein S26e [Candidatus Helarchaeales archaeon]
MPKKRRSGGRSKSGATGVVTCCKCGRTVPRDKAKKSTRKVSLVEYKMVKELRDQGAIIPHQKIVEYYCISCAVHRGKVQIRSKADRKSKSR